MEIIIGIISVIVGLISLVATFIFYRKSLIIKVPLFTVESRGTAGGFTEFISKLSLNYNGEKINFFTVSRIAIWNAGKSTIKKNDLLESDQLRIVPEVGYKFLHAKINHVINPLNNFRIKFTPKLILIDFDYVDFNEGCCVEVQHNGKSSWALQVKGSIIGAGKIKHSKAIHFPKRRKKAFTISTFTFIFGSLISLLIFGWKDTEIRDKILLINSIVAVIIYAILPMVISILYLKRNRTSLKLGVIDDDEHLKAPDFPPTGRVRKRDKDADSYW